MIKKKSFKTMNELNEFIAKEGLNKPIDLIINIQFNPINYEKPFLLFYWY